MPGLTPVIVDYDMVTAFGRGPGCCWQGIIEGNTAIKEFNRFNLDNFQSKFAADVSGLRRNAQESLVMQMLKPMLKDKGFARDSFLILATTTGEIEFLELDLLEKKSNYKKSQFSYLAKKVKDVVNVSSAITISGACSSANIALACAGSLIASGRKDCVLVVACDSISEFVFSGFSSLMALDKERAAPFDKNRSGLTIGEAAGFMLLMSPKRAQKEKRNPIAKLAGWATSNDANHMTGPSRKGEGLKLAINTAINCAKQKKENIGSISAHGTGTKYNDSMEMKAFKEVFKKSLPTYSIKGAIGHTMGAAGLIQAIIAIESLKNKIIPPTIGLNEVDAEAKGWVSNKRQINDKNLCLSVNAGFGGINTAVLLER